MKLIVKINVIKLHESEDEAKIVIKEYHVLIQQI